jgi:hypothetical protein
MYNPLTVEEKSMIINLWHQDLSSLQIAININRTSNTVMNYLKREGIFEKRYRPNRLISVDKERDIIYLYSEGYNCVELGEKFKVSSTCIRDILKRNNITIREPHKSRRPIDQKGSNSNAWKGGRRQAYNGYILIYVSPEDSLRCMTNGNGSYVGEHRIVMARYIGRPLTSKESVHHINGDVADNRIENLQLRFGNHGPGKALCCADCGSINIIERVI